MLCTKKAPAACSVGLEHEQEEELSGDLELLLGLDLRQRFLNVLGHVDGLEHERSVFLDVKGLVRLALGNGGLDPLLPLRHALGELRLVELGVCVGKTARAQTQAYKANRNERDQSIDRWIDRSDHREGAKGEGRGRRAAMARGLTSALRLGGRARGLP